MPFAAAVNRCFMECQLRANRPRLLTAVMTGAQARFDADLKLMTDMAKSSEYMRYIYFLNRLMFFGFSSRVVQKRKQNPTNPDNHKDLLDQMLTAIDTKTGEKMTDDSIVDNV